MVKTFSLECQTPTLIEFMFSLFSHHTRTNIKGKKCSEHTENAVTTFFESEFLRISVFGPVKKEANRFYKKSSYLSLSGTLHLP